MTTGEFRHHFYAPLTQPPIVQPGKFKGPEEVLTGRIEIIVDRDNYAAVKELFPSGVFGG
ncbi:hypothetical protein ACFL2C_02725 [Patescibacteria group bacterium]